jgi:hypothetical protein
MSILILDQFSLGQTVYLDEIPKLNFGNYDVNITYMKLSQIYMNNIAIDIDKYDIIYISIDRSRYEKFFTISFNVLLDIIIKKMNDKAILIFNTNLPNIKWNDINGKDIKIDLESVKKYNIELDTGFTTVVSKNVDHINAIDKKFSLPTVGLDIKINTNIFIKWIIANVFKIQQTWSSLNEQPEHNYNYKNIAGICLLIIICAVTVWVIKYVYPYLKRKLTQNQLYIVMGIISIVLFGITAFILWYFISLFIQIWRDNYLKNYDMGQSVVPANAIPFSDEYKSSSQSEHEPAIQDHSNRISNSTNEYVPLDNDDADAL